MIYSNSMAEGSQLGCSVPFSGRVSARSSYFPSGGQASSAERAVALEEDSLSFSQLLQGASSKSERDGSPVQREPSFAHVIGGENGGGEQEGTRGGGKSTEAPALAVRPTSPLFDVGPLEQAMVAGEEGRSPEAESMRTAVEGRAFNLKMIDDVIDDFIDNIVKAVGDMAKGFGDMAKDIVGGITDDAGKMIDDLLGGLFK